MLPIASRMKQALSPAAASGDSGGSQPGLRLADARRLGHDRHRAASLIGRVQPAPPARQARATASMTASEA